MTKCIYLTGICNQKINPSIFRFYSPLYFSPISFQIIPVDSFHPQIQTQNQELGVAATRIIPKGTIIHHLSGIMIPDRWIKNHQNMSHVADGETFGTLLGPIRFVNHSCQPNTIMVDCCAKSSTTPIERKFIS